MDIKDRLLMLLEVSARPLQTDVICKILGDGCEADVNAAIIALAMQGSVEMGPAGISIAGVGTSSVTEPAPEAEPENPSEPESPSEPEPSSEPEPWLGGKTVGDIIDEISARHEPIIELKKAQDGEEAGEEIPSELKPRLHKTDSIERLGASAYITGQLMEAGVKTVGEYVARALDPGNSVLTNATQPRTAGLFRQHLGSMSRIETTDQYRALLGLSGSVSCVFDMFGFAAKPTDPEQQSTNSAEDNNADGSGEVDTAIPLERILKVGYLSERLAREGIVTLGDLQSKTDEELLSIQGFGAGKLNKVITSVGEFMRTRRAARPTAEDVVALKGSMDLADFESIFGAEAIEAARAAYGLVDPSGMIVDQDTFIVVMAPYARQAIESSASDPARATVDSFWNLPGIVDECEDALVSRLETSVYGDGFEIEVPSGVEWMTAAKAAAARLGLEFDEGARTFARAAVALADWLETFEGREGDILRMRFEGQTLDEVGNAFGLTRQRVSQIEKKACSGRPRIDEEKYRYLVETYRMDADTFSGITGEDRLAYGYLKVTSEEPAPVMDVREGQEDELLPVDIRASISKLVDAESIFLNGERVEPDRLAITCAILAREGGPVSKWWLVSEYERALEETGFEDKSYSRRNYEAWLTRQEEILFAPTPRSFDPEGKDVRLYDTSDKDFTILEDYLTSGIFDGQETTTLAIFDEPAFAPVKEALDIRNGYELHVIIRSWCPDLQGIELGRMPSIRIANDCSKLKEDVPAAAVESPEVSESEINLADIPAQETESAVWEERLDPEISTEPETGDEPAHGPEYGRDFDEDVAQAVEPEGPTAEELESAKEDLESWLSDMLAGEFETGQLPPSWVAMLNEAEECVVNDEPYPESLLISWSKRSRL